MAILRIFGTPSQIREGVYADLHFAHISEAQIAARNVISALVPEAFRADLRSKGIIGVGIISLIEDEIRKYPAKNYTYGSYEYSHPEVKFKCVVIADIPDEYECGCVCHPGDDSDLGKHKPQAICAHCHTSR